MPRGGFGRGEAQGAAMQLGPGAVRRRGARQARAPLAIGQIPSVSKRGERRELSHSGRPVPAADARCRVWRNARGVLSIAAMIASTGPLLLSGFTAIRSRRRRTGRDRFDELEREEIPESRQRTWRLFCAVRIGDRRAPWENERCRLIPTIYAFAVSRRCRRRPSSCSSCRARSRCPTTSRTRAARCTASCTARTIGSPS